MGDEMNAFVHKMRNGAVVVRVAFFSALVAIFSCKGSAAVFTGAN
jgi:hypothetical protein